MNFTFILYTLIINLSSSQNDMPNKPLFDIVNTIFYGTGTYRRFGGEEGGDWVVTIRDQQCTVEPGVTENPTMTLKADAEDYKSVILGKLDPMAAFMQQKLKLTGNLNMALGLTKFFKMR